jgi:DNA replication protein DnaC
MEILPVTGDEYIESRMKQFKLVDMRKAYSSLIEEAKTTGMEYRDFLIRLLKTEEDGKKSRRQERLKRLAQFDMVNTLDDIDYGFNPSLDRAKIEDLGKLSFMEDHENIIIIGPPGVGKSMIATGIGMNACRAGHKVLFVNAKDLIERMYEEMMAGTLASALERMNRIPLLIIDELSYLKMDKEKESIFFQIIRQRYEKSSLIITTNLPLGRWDEVFTGQLAATAILDRLVHHCHVLSITGDSYRVKGKKTKKEEEAS